MTTTRDGLVRQIQESRHDGRALTQAVAALDAFDRETAGRAAASRELDMGAEIVAHRMTPGTAHELHTAATDWLADFEIPPTDYRTTMIAEASTWYRGLGDAVRADGEELYAQARGRALTLASAYGSRSLPAAQEFLRMVGYLSQSHGASGLPQIDQTIDADNQPAPTPYPTEVFPTFGEEQDEFNRVETDSHGSGASSEGAPLLQQVRQQDSSGSGFGSGPERPDQHSTGPDYSDSYAEVPLGAPGTLPTTPAVTDRAAGSTPNPVAGTDQDAGAGRRRSAAVEGYSYPDAFGYRWMMTPEVMHPFHERCASAHWPDESCADNSHTASLAIGYQMDLDKARSLQQAEETGVREGLLAFRGSKNLGELVAFHNRFASAWGQSDRTAEDTAVLHGFMAVVRPVMAEMTTGAEGIQVQAAGGLKVVRYIDEMAGQYHAAPVGGDRQKAAARGGRLDFSEAATAALLKGAPFAGYSDFGDCEDQNSEKDDPAAYCGEIKHRTEDGKTAASTLTQVQQITDPDNKPAPQDDDLPDGVAFPLNEAWQQQWETGPGGAAPKGKSAEAARMNGMPTAAASLFGHLDALDSKDPRHKDDYPFSAKAHGTYLRAWNGTHAGMAAINGKAPLTAPAYGDMTGRPDLYPHWQDAYDQARRALSTNQGHAGPKKEGLRAQADSGSGVHPDTNRCTDCGHLPGCGCTHDCDSDPIEHHASRKTADAWSQPRQSTDDFAPPFSQPATDPPMTQGGGDYEAGAAAGRSDRAAGERPAFADNSSAVSPYVKGYAETYGAAPGPQGAQDVPYSMGGDSGQAANAGEVQRAFQVAHASRVSDSFVPPGLRSDPDFAKGYLFASKWRPGQRMVSTGSAAFEAGLYAGVTDRPGIQAPWLTTHGELSCKPSNPGLASRVALHASFTAKTAGRHGLSARGAYLVRVAAGDDDEPTVRELQDAQTAGLLEPHERLSEISPDRAREIVRRLRKRRTAGTSTDLITDGPGTSPDPMGATPLNGPGTPPPMGGRDEAATPGGSPPYQGAPPLPGGPVVPDEVMGQPQQPPQPSGPFTNTFSGEHPGNATLAPAAPNSANEPGYSNRDAYAGDPHGRDRVARKAAFRRRAQAGLAALKTGGS